MICLVKPCLSTIKTHLIKLIYYEKQNRKMYLGKQKNNSN